MSNDKPKSKKLNASKFKFAIAASQFNGAFVDALLKDVRARLIASGTKISNIRVVRVPGAGELPYAASALVQLDYDAVIVLGVVIAGDTPHHLVIANSTASALQEIAIKNGTPIINGIIVTNNREQAEARTTGEIRRGTEFADCAVEMAKLATGFVKEISKIDSELESFAKSLGFDGDDDDDDGNWTFDSGDDEEEDDDTYDVDKN